MQGIQRIGVTLASTDLARVRPYVSTEGEYQPQEQPAPDQPAHVDKFCQMIQSYFAYPADGRAWNKHDTRDYGRQVYGLTEAQCVPLLALLRDRHTFRPSVAEVRAAVLELYPDLKPEPKPERDNSPAYARSSYHDIDAPGGVRSEHRADFTRPALPSRSQYPGGGQQLLRDTMKRLNQIPAKQPRPFESFLRGEK